MADVLDIKVIEGGEARRVWRCSVCGRLDVWGPSWEWFGSLRQLDERPESIYVLCGVDCKARFEARRG